MGFTGYEFVGLGSYSIKYTNQDGEGPYVVE